MKIEEIDKNFRTAETDGRKWTFFNAMEAPAVLSGFPWYEGVGPLSRLPAQIMPLVNEGVRSLTFNTSGGMIRFKTDATAIAIDVDLYEPCDMNHMPRNGSAGFDLYLGSGTDKVYYRSAMPDSGAKKLTAMMAWDLKPGIMREWTLYLPLYGGASRIEVGVTPGSTVEAPTPFTYPEPVVFYGSSITQGGCASRTGNAYSNILCRWFDANEVNLGFSGSGKGEPAVAETIAALPMSAFVLDYDHNAPTPEYLEQTHEPFFRTIRERQPELPVLMISKCDYVDDPVINQRRDIIRKTYEHAVAQGDRNVWFIDGETLFAGPDRDSCMVDGCHPNDLGFYRMATVIRPVLAAALAASGVKCR